MDMQNNSFTFPRTQIIGQCINPAGRPDVATALQSKDFAYIAKLACAQYEAGARYIDICVALPGIDEVSALKESLNWLRRSCPEAIPVLDSPDIKAIGRALEGYDGRVIINSATAEPQKLSAALEIAQRHSAPLIALAMDSHPGDADARVDAIRRIVRRADAVNFSRENIIADCLAISECAKPGQARVTLEALGRVRAEFGLRTVLGISNVSSGLPKRECLNTAFLALAVARGLDYAIANPFDDSIRDALSALELLTGFDDDALNYIHRAHGNDRF